METIVTIATVPAVIALVTLAKDLGLPSKLAPLVSVLLGVGLTVLDALATTGVGNWYQIISTGIILGLSASGLYDGARIIGENRQSELTE